MNRWDQYFMNLAYEARSMSKDPSTKVGAALVSPDRRKIHTGWNGFPRGIQDDDRLNIRELKYPIIIHAELNAILNAKECLDGWTAYVTLHPCRPCASCLIQSGIRRLVTLAPSGRWGDEGFRAKEVMLEAGMTIDYWE